MGKLLINNRYFFKEIFIRDIKFFSIMYILEFCQVFVSICMPIIMMRIIDLLIMEGSLYVIIIMNLLYFCLSILMCILRYIYMLVNYKWRINFEYCIQRKIIYNCSDIESEKTYVTGDVDTIIKKDTSQVEEFILKIFFEISGNILRFITLVVTIFYLEWHLAICILVINFIILFLQGKSNKNIEENANKIREEYSKLFDVSTEVATKTNILAEIGARKYALKKYENIFKVTMQYVFKGLKMNMKISQEISFLGYFVQIIILIYGSTMVYADYMTVGTVISFLQYSGQVMSPLQILLKFPNDIANNTEVLKKIINTVEEYSDITDIDKKSSLYIKSVNKINIFNMSFAYPNNKKVFNNINVVLNKHNINVIMGESGIGKTTLFKILLGKINNYTGKIYINDKDLRLLSGEEILRYIGYLPQTDIIFKDSIRENICLGRNITQEQLENICVSCEIHDEINKMEKGYDTVLCPENINISGGQIKRIMLARMLVEEKPILLLDEPTSSLDGDSTIKIIHTLQKISKDKLILVITHDNKFMEYSDCIYQVKDKKIVKYKEVIYE